MKRLLVAAVLLLGILYASDYLFAIIRKHNPKAGQPFGTVTVQHYYSIPHKDGKAELVFQDPQTQACVRSLFPHFGYTPCWYARRESHTPIPMDIVVNGIPPAPRCVTNKYVDISHLMYYRPVNDDDPSRKAVAAAPGSLAHTSREN